MPAFSGIVAASAIYAASAGINAGEYDSRTFTQPPYTVGYAAAAALSGAITPNTVSVSHSSLSGTIAPTFGLTDWYYRIHITPAALALGNVVSSVIATVGVWNAWLETPQTLNSITGVSVSGITLTGGGSLPQLFKTNQQVNYSVIVGTAGAPTINGSYTWAFADGESVVLAITGNRISAWAASPDWSSPVVERMEWKTDVLQSWSGIEQRRALRIAPRRTIEFDAPIWKSERRFIEAVLSSWSARVWALPIWHDGQKLPSALAPGAISIACDTVNRDFMVGGMVILILDAAHFEVGVVQTLTSTLIGLNTPIVGSWPAGSRLYPARAARLVSFPKITRDNDDCAIAKPSFVIVEPCDWPVATGLPTYRSYPVLEMAPAVGGSEGVYEREAVTLDNDTGTISVDDRAGLDFPTQSHAWFMSGRSALNKLRSLLYMLKGRQGTIWVPTYQRDLLLIANVTSAQTTIDVEMTGATLYLAGARNRQDIRIELFNGTVYYRRVTGATTLDAYSERLSIDSSLGANVSVSQIRRISFMAPSRLNSDSIEIQHHTMTDGLSTSVTPWRAVGDNI